MRIHDGCRGSASPVARGEFSARRRRDRVSTTRLMPGNLVESSAARKAERPGRKSSAGAGHLTVRAQSLSVPEVHPVGQQPSSGTQAVTAVWLQARVQSSLLPVIPSVVQGLWSSQEVGQEDGGSQVSPVSTTPLPQTDEQSESLFALHTLGQQPSPETQAVMVVWLQVTLQLVRLPVLASVVQAMSSSQEVGQEDGGSQVSPDSITLLPQVGVQSESLLALHAAGQQPSAATQAVMMV